MKRRTLVGFLILAMLCIVGGCDQANLDPESFSAFDNTPNGEFVINWDDESTTSRDVTLNILGDNFGKGEQMRFSNDNEIWTEWEDFDNTKAWVLSNGVGKKAVYVQFTNEHGDILTARDTIEYTCLELDGTVNATINEWPNTTLNIDVPGAEGMRFSIDNETWSDWEEYQVTKEYVFPAEGPGILYAQFSANPEDCNTEYTIEADVPGVEITLTNPSSDKIVVLRELTINGVDVFADMGGLPESGVSFDYECPIKFWDTYPAGQLETFYQTCVWGDDETPYTEIIPHWDALNLIPERHYNLIFSEDGLQHTVEEIE